MFRPFALLAAALLSIAAAAQDAGAARRLAIFDQVWSQVGAHYYDPRMNGVDWAAARARHRPAAAAAPDDHTLHLVLRAMLGELRDAHTRLLSPDQARDRRRQRTTSAGVVLFEVEGRPTVFAVRPGSPAAAAGLTPGMAVLAVNGVPAAEAIARARAEVGPSSSDRAGLVLAWLRLIAGPPDEPLRLDLANADGTAPRSVALARVPLDAAPRFEARMLPSNILHVRFDTFRAPVARLFRAALREHEGARGLILDLRSNTGGDGREGARMVAPLLDGPTLIARLATRTGRAPSALLGLVKLPLRLSAGEAGGRLFAGPVVILVNQGTGSTSEVIAASLQERGRARVVGTRSCGCALGVLRYRRLATGGALAISEIGLVSGLGRRIEGEGVVPDVPVELTLADLAAGRDRVLEAAVQALEGAR
ncbi:MAG TPA: S41 family peptidase [Allosphingosinicella sp.]|nr:S41 family peptidase [Allosphingosinicella sp.]